MAPAEEAEVGVPGAEEKCNREDLDHQRATGCNGHGSLDLCLRNNGRRCRSLRSGRSR